MDVKEIRKAKYLEKSILTFGDSERSLPRSDLRFNRAEETFLKIH